MATNQDPAKLRYNAVSPKPHDCVPAAIMMVAARLKYQQPTMRQLIGASGLTAPADCEDVCKYWNDSRLRVKEAKLAIAKLRVPFQLYWLDAQLYYRDDVSWRRGREKKPKSGVALLKIVLERGAQYDWDLILCLNRNKLADKLPAGGPLLLFDGLTGTGDVRMVDPCGSSGVAHVISVEETRDAMLARGRKLGGIWELNVGRQ